MIPFLERETRNPGEN